MNSWRFYRNNLSVIQKQTHLFFPRHNAKTFD
jgi:hypothetical protein